METRVSFATLNDLCDWAVRESLYQARTLDGDLVTREYLRRWVYQLGIPYQLVTSSQLEQLRHAIVGVHA